MIIAITGASGVGKTFTLKQISHKLNAQCFHFDDISMPNWDEVDSKEWQKETTIKWIDKLVEVSINENVNIIFEGSTEFKFFIQGFEKNKFLDYQLLLFDCSKGTMKNRLIKREQAELYTQKMENWLRYLRREAIKLDIEIIRTDLLTMEEIEQIFINKVM